MAFYSKEYDLFLGVTESFCHSCNHLDRLIPAHFVTRGNEVWLRKFCPDCGNSWALVSTDYTYFRLCNDYLKRPDLPECSLTPILHGCPFDCGVCPQHQNHPCLALFNVIDECNMKCHVCYRDSWPGKGNARTMEDIERMHDTLLQIESAPDIIQITGGEPTLHPQILDIIRYLKSGPVRHLMLNTNGIRISEDEAFVRELKCIGKGFEVYLQFDSLEADALSRLRGGNVRHIREKALAALDSQGISTTLVCVIQKWLNDGEIGALIEYATRWKCVRGIVFQPIQDAGRNEADSDYRLTLSEIRRKIVDEPGNPFSAEDMIPLPCDPHKICVWYAIKTHDGKILPVTGKIPREMITEQKGTIAFEQDRTFIKNVVETVTLDTALSEAIVGKDSIKHKLFCCWPEFLAPETMTYENVFRIVIMEFSDAYNFDTGNIKRECNFMIEPGLAIPFSTHNMGLHKRKNG